MKELFSKAQDVIESRKQWEDRQRTYYLMRREGIRRRNKPFPAAADLHFPLIDMNVRKAKPFWFAQATSTERLAAFTCLKDQEKATTTSAADFFDWEIKQNTDFFKALWRNVDIMCVHSRGVFKSIVDPFDDYRIKISAINPLFILMAPGAEDFEDADWFVHVTPLTVAGYKRNRRYTQDVIDKIRGIEGYTGADGPMEDRHMSEGINYSRNPDEIILYEHYVKTMSGWTVNTYCPMAPEVDVRKPYTMPYKVCGKASVPFHSVVGEIVDGGWYAPRGLAELNAPFESYTCKLWNEKTDAMTFSNRPVFTSENQLTNVGNLRWAPGEFIPGNVKGVQMPTPAFSFDQEIAFARSTAEQLSMLPDFGIVKPGEQGDTGGKPRTAAENNRIAQLQSVGTDSNGQIFRLYLGKLYKHLWGLMLQFRRKELSYFVADQLKTVPDQALHDAYLIAPDGAPDQWNKQQRMQRAMARYQMFQGAPNVDMDVITKDALNSDDPKLGLEAFIPTNVKAGSEAEDEATELLLLREGFPAQVKPNEDHVTRIHVLMGWLQKQAQSGAAPDPVAIQRVQEHMAVHLQFLHKTQPQAARQVEQDIEAAMQQTGPAQPAPGGAGPMPGGPPQPGMEQMNPS